MTQLSKDVTDLFISKGNVESDTIWIYEQGGPDGDLSDDELENFPNHSNYLNVYVHQVLTYNNELFDKDLTVEQGEMETALNTEILHRVIQHFKGEDKTVIVFGHSYGSFVVAQYLSKKGSDLADKYVMMGGRLDAEKALYEGWINKKFYYYPDYVTPTLHPEIQPENNKDRTELLLGGIAIKPRFTKELSNVNLKKVIYAYAKDDKNVGRLTSDEIKFLESKNVSIVEIESGGHGAMFDPPNNQTIYELTIK